MESGYWSAIDWSQRATMLLVSRYRTKAVFNNDFDIVILHYANIRTSPHTRILAWCLFDSVMSGTLENNMSTPNVTAFFDATTNTATYVVVDPASNKCVVIDLVLDYDTRLFMCHDYQS